MSAPTDFTPVPADTSSPTVAETSPSPAVEAPAADTAAGSSPGEQAPATPPAPEPAAGAATPQPDEFEKADEAADLDAILPNAEQLTVGDIPCTVRRIKLRELMLLAQIISAGPGTRIAALDWSNVTQEQVFAMAMIALPDAEAEVFNFLRAVVEPREKTRADELQPHLNNPEPSDFLAIVGVLVLQERDEFARLGKELQQMVKGLTALWRTGKRGT